METTGLTDTEVLTRINALKIRHENLKKEIIDLIITIEQKEKEIITVEEEYMTHLGKMIQ